MNLTDFYAMLYRDLGEAAIGNDRVPEALLLAVLNEAYRNVCRRTGALERDFAQTLIAGQAAYALPADVFDILDRNTISDGIADWPAPRILRDTLEGLCPAPLDAAGAPQYLCLKSTTHYEVYPTPDDAAAYTAAIHGKCLPVAAPPSGGFPLLDAAHPTPALHEAYHRLLALEAEYLLLTRALADVDGAQARAESVKAELEGMYPELGR